MGSLTGSTSLKQMIVTAAQAIMRHTFTKKKKWRNLSRSEHSGNLQWEIWKCTNFLSSDVGLVVLLVHQCIVCGAMQWNTSLNGYTYHKLFVAQILILAQFTTGWTTSATWGDFQPFLKEIYTPWCTIFYGYCSIWVNFSTQRGVNSKFCK